MMIARTTRPVSTSTSSGDSSAGRSCPHQASSTTTAEGPAASLTAPPAPPAPTEVRAGAPLAEAAPRMEATPPATASVEAAPAGSAGATVKAPSIEPAAEEVAAETPVEAATAGAATAEVVGAGDRRTKAGVPSSGP
jgi:hypothetical protein